ncbi:hypothetical protein D3C73_1210110 [compost metagenome]
MVLIACQRNHNTKYPHDEHQNELRQLHHVAQTKCACIQIVVIVGPLGKNQNQKGKEAHATLGHYSRDIRSGPQVRQLCRKGHSRSGDHRKNPADKITNRCTHTAGQRCLSIPRNIRENDGAKRRIPHYQSDSREQAKGSAGRLKCKQIT